MKNQALWGVVAALALLAAVVLFGMWSREKRAVAAVRDEVKAAAATAEEAAQGAAREKNAVQEQLTQAQERLAALEKERTDAIHARDGLEQELRSSLKDKELTISELEGKLTVNILDQVLFPSGEAALKPGGEAMLKKIADVLRRYPDHQVLVAGYTDNVPVRLNRARFATNWELSALRATAAVRFLCEKAKIDPKHLAAVGYGEFHPVADNATAAGRARNRRIEMVILGRDLLVPAKPAAVPVPAVPAAPAAKPVPVTPAAAPVPAAP
jgi:chemotaxis protein MotB